MAGAPKKFRKELTPAFVEAARKKPRAKEYVPAILSMTERVRSDILLPASKDLGSIEIERKDTSDLRISDAKTLTIKTDRECEAMMEKQLRAAYPGAIFLGEEMFGAATKAEKIQLAKEAVASNKPIILVDALDATRDFRNGGDGYSVMVAVVQNDKMKAAVVHRCTDHADPSDYGHTLTFEDTDAVRVNGQLVRPLSSRAFPDDTTQLRGYATIEFIKGKEADGFPNLSGKFDSLSDLWTCSKMFADIVTGRHHFMLVTPPADIFDYPAGIALIQQAGGVARFLDGKDATFTEIVKRQEFMQSEGHKGHLTLDNTLVLAVSENVFKAVQNAVLPEAAPQKNAAPKP